MKYIVLLLAFIFSISVQARHISTYTAALPIGDWKPTTGEVISAIDTMHHDLPKYQRQQKRSVRPFDEYRIQYYGVIRDKKKILMINALCSDFWPRAKDWKERLIIVKDGGGCFFQAQYDVEASKILVIRINGAV